MDRQPDEAGTNGLEGRGPKPTPRGDIGGGAGLLQRCGDIDGGLLRAARAQFRNHLHDHGRTGHAPEGCRRDAPLPHGRPWL